MEQAQWIAAVQKALRDGPVRFTYDRLRITYILRDHGQDVGGKWSPSYSMRVEYQGRMMLHMSAGSSGLDKILQEHPLDRFTPERKLPIPEES